MWLRAWLPLVGRDGVDLPGERVQLLADLDQQWLQRLDHRLDHGLVALGEWRLLGHGSASGSQEGWGGAGCWPWPST